MMRPPPPLESWCRKLGAAAGELVLAMPSVVAGPVDRVAEELQHRRERYGLFYLMVADGDTEAFAPVVQYLAGR